jgi:DNA mismatch repair protein MutS
MSAADFEVRCFEQYRFDRFLNEFYKKFPRELVIAESYKTQLDRITGHFPELSMLLVNELPDYEFNKSECEQVVKDHFGLETIEGLGLKGNDPSIIAAGVLLKYLQSVRKTALKNITTLKFMPDENYLIMDSASFKNLEILLNLRTGTKSGSLFGAVDFSLTPMGKRLLKKWLSYPLIEKKDIINRLDGVDELLHNLIARTEVRKILKDFGDLAKLNSKISLNIVLPSQLLMLKEILLAVPRLKNEIENLNSKILKQCHNKLKPLKNVLKMINEAIMGDPSNNLNEGNFIKSGYNQELDELRNISRNAKEIVSAMENTEKEQTGIPSLKIRYNKVFGYFIEVTRTHLKLVPPRYIRKQTLVNSERFITGELKDLEDKILKAEEKIVQIEKTLFSKLIEQIQSFSSDLNKNANLIALLDVLAAGAHLAQKRGFCRPEIHNRSEIEIKEGRHPVVEINSEKGFIPNDTLLNAQSNQILIITGPNMGGKSTYLRQNALIVILAQIGYFVPVEKASIGICDRIFTRIGASDSLIEGKSTFLVEMIETSIILNNTTSRSLVLLDEIGRGTSTFDGLSIAWAVIEYLHSIKERPKTLFATHYHELTELSNVLDRVKNYHITVREWQDNVVFLHKIIAGASDQSFGIHVAKIAGIPEPVIERSKEILLNLEKKEFNRLVKERISGKIKKISGIQQNLFSEDAEFKIWDEIREKLKDVDITRITPLEALNILHFLKRRSENLK